MPCPPLGLPLGRSQVFFILTSPAPRAVTGPCECARLKEQMNVLPLTGATEGSGQRGTKAAPQSFFGGQEYSLYTENHALIFTKGFHKPVYSAFPPPRGRYQSVHFTDGEPVAQRGQVCCPSMHIGRWQRLLAPRAACLQAQHYSSWLLCSPIAGLRLLGSLSEAR